jgi:hypothetical protein
MATQATAAMPTAAVLRIGRHRTGQRKGEKSNHSFHISIHSCETSLTGHAGLETAEIRAHAGGPLHQLCTSERGIADTPVYFRAASGGT